MAACQRDSSLLVCTDKDENRQPSSGTPFTRAFTYDHLCCSHSGEVVFLPSWGSTDMMSLRTEAARERGSYRHAALRSDPVSTSHSLQAWHWADLQMSWVLSFIFYLFHFFQSFIDVEVVYKGVIISGVQQGDSVIHIQEFPSWLSGNDLDKDPWGRGFHP